jgi:acetyl esterase
MARKRLKLRHMAGGNQPPRREDHRVSQVSSVLRLDPELAAISVLIPEFDLSEVREARRLEQQLADQGRHPVPGVVTEDRVITRRDGGAMNVRLYRPQSKKLMPAVLYIHGGAFMLGGLSTEEDRCGFYARDADCVVVAIDYRLAPEHPYPAALEDSEDALSWLHNHARDLQVDPRRIAIGGNSAGGALAAAVALESRNPDSPPLIHQLLVNPVLDYRSDSASMRSFTSTPGWTRGNNVLMWETYLGGAGDLDHRASPALVVDAAGAPSASIWIAEYDPLRDEGYDYARTLMHAGVQVSVMQYPGTFHGFDSYRMTSVGQRAHKDQILALRRAFRR